MAIRRPTKVARKQEPIKHSEENIIYAWPVKSMTNRQAFGGKTVTYEVVMYKDGELYCNCAAWQFAHARDLDADVAAYARRPRAAPARKKKPP